MDGISAGGGGGAGVPPGEDNPSRAPVIGSSARGKAKRWGNFRSVVLEWPITSLPRRGDWGAGAAETREGPTAAKREKAMMGLRMAAR